MARTANIGSSGYNFGAGGYAGFHRVQLPGLGTIPRDDSTDAVTNFRKGILFYFGHCELPEVGFSDVKSVFKDAKSKVKDVKDSIETAKKEDWGRNHEVQTVSAAVTDALKEKKAKMPRWLAQVSDEAAARVQAQMPYLIGGMLSEIGKLSVPVAGNIRNFGKSFVEGVRKTKTYWNTRGLEDALRSGEPQVIVAALRKELSDDAKASFANAIYEAAKGVASVVTAGASEVVAKVIDVVKAFLAYIWKLYKRIHDYLALKRFFVECRQKFTANDNVIFNTSLFRAWVSGWVDELPIIASHCICSTVTGSYYGFLSTLTSDEALAASYGKFASLKGPAKSYVNGYSLKFSSSDPMVNQSLLIIQNGGVDLTDGAAAQSLGWLRRKLMKKGLVKRTVYGNLG